VLAEMALVQRSRDAPGKLRPTSPQVGLAALVARAEAALARRQHEIEATRAVIRTLAEAHQTRLRRDEVIHLETLDSVRVRLEEVATSARTECLSFSPGAAHRPDAMAASKPLNQVALERGVRIRAVYQESCRNDTATLAYARWLANLGGHMRTAPVVPMQLVIVDREIAFLPINPDDSRLGAIEVHSPGVVAALCTLFEQVWAAATPFDVAAPADEHGLRPQERELLRLLGDGYTDEAAARKLGLSVRTVQRMMADLVSRLNAASRFQAGANAVRQGWL